MSLPLIRHEVAMMLHQTDLQIADAEAKIAKGSFRQRVNAAGELSFLKRQKATVEDRLKEIAARPEATETLWQWVEEEVFNLNLRLESWIARS